MGADLDPSVTAWSSGEVLYLFRQGALAWIVSVEVEDCWGMYLPREQDLGWFISSLATVFSETWDRSCLELSNDEKQKVVESEITDCLGCRSVYSEFER